MASWIRKEKADVDRFYDEDDHDARRSHAGQDINDGQQVDRPDGIDPFGPESFMKLRSLIWSDLKTVGFSLRKIADLFEVNKDLVARAIKDVPDEIRAGRRPVARYFDRLREVVELNPSSLEEFTELMQRRAGTLGFEPGVFRGLGVRRSSVSTVLGTPRRSRAKELKATS